MSETIRWEDAAEVRSVKGWACKVCGGFYPGESEGQEHAARWCHGHRDKPCQTPGCANRVTSLYNHCEACEARRDSVKWHAKPKVDWDGETPLCEYRSDRYFFDADTLAEHTEDRLADGATVDQLRFVLCEPDQPPDFDITEFLSDHLPDDDHGGSPFGSDETKAINKTVNDWIAARLPFCWVATNQAVSPESLPLPLPEGGGE